MITKAEAVARITAHRGRLLDRASDLLDRAELFVDVPEVADELITEARSLFAQSEHFAPSGAR